MFELHVTISPITAAELTVFTQLCKRVGGNALLVELSRGQHRWQPMLTMLHGGALDDIPVIINNINTQLIRHGYFPTRSKIEMDIDCVVPVAHIAYVEWHGRVEVNLEKVAGLCLLCEACGAHLSRNALRNTTHRYITVRAESKSSLVDNVHCLLKKLSQAGWSIEKQRWESVISQVI